MYTNRSPFHFSSKISRVPMAFAALLLGLTADAHPGHRQMGLHNPAAEAEYQFSATWPATMPADGFLPASATTVSVQLTNREAKELSFRLDAYTDEDGIRIPKARVQAVLRAQETRTVKISLDLTTATNLAYSGKLVVQASAAATTGTPGPSTLAVLPGLYFHPVSGGFRLYNASTMRSVYRAGNFRNVAVNTSSALQALQRAVISAGLPSGTPVAVERVGAAPVIRVAGEPTSGGARQFCVSMPGETYYNSSNRVWISDYGTPISVDYQESFGRAGQQIPMARAWVSVAQFGAPLYSGMLTASGCTPSIPAAANVPTTIAISPLYLHTGDNIRGFVSDANLAPPLNTMPLFFLNFQSSANQITAISANPAEYAQVVYAAAAQSMERFPGGAKNVLYEWNVRAAGSNAGSATVYATAGHPLIYLKYPAALNKFTIAHEYGHAILMGRVSPKIAADDVDYSVEEGEQESNHTMNSKEWQLIAAFEGFANFVAAVTWCDTSANSSGVYVLGSDENPNLNTSYDFGPFSKWFETHWNANGYPDQGVELDWAQFFWNYYTDPPLFGPFAAPSQATLVNLFLASYPWPKHEGFWADFAGGAAVVLPPTVPPATVMQALSWFEFMASSAGIVH